MSQISFADIDPASVESSIIAAYESISQTTLYPGDSMRLFLESLAHVITVQNNVIDLAGRQNLLAFAQGGHLEHVALLMGTERLGEVAARCTQRFSLSSPAAFDVHIPAGTRVTTADAGRVFATSAAAVIPAGQTFVDAVVQAEQPGAAGNGLIAGQINRMVAPVANIASTENVSVTVFGAGVESDDRLRARLRLAPEAFSCAGSRGAYRYHAMSAHQDVADVAVWRPQPGVVDVRPVLEGGELPTEAILALIRTRLNAEDVIPLTDTVIVTAPEPLGYSLDVAWALSRANEALAVDITARVDAAVESYRQWQRSVPGRDINPTKLISLMEQAGARRVTTGFSFQQLEPRRIARETAVNVTFLGVEDE